MTSMRSFNLAVTTDSNCPQYSLYDTPIATVGNRHPPERHKIRKVLFPELVQLSTPVVPRIFMPQGGRPDEANER